MSDSKTNVGDSIFRLAWVRGGAAVQICPFRPHQNEGVQDFCDIDPLAVVQALNYPKIAWVIARHQKGLIRHM